MKPWFFLFTFFDQAKKINGFGQSPMKKIQIWIFDVQLNKRIYHCAAFFCSKTEQWTISENRN